MNIFQRDKNYIVEKNSGEETTLLFVTSVAFYKSKMIRTENRWKAEDDSKFLKGLIDKAINDPTEINIKPLLDMESYYRELSGNVPKNATPAEAAAILDSRGASQSDIYYKGLKKDLPGELTEKQAHLLAEQPSLGDLVSAKRTENGNKRFSWRNKK